MSDKFTVPQYADTHNMTLGRARRAVIRLEADGKVRKLGHQSNGKRGRNPVAYEYVTETEPSAAE